MSVAVTIYCWRRFQRRRGWRTPARTRGPEPLEQKGSETGRCMRFSHSSDHLCFTVSHSRSCSSRCASNGSVPTAFSSNSGQFFPDIARFLFELRFVPPEYFQSIFYG